MKTYIIVGCFILGDIVTGLLLAAYKGTINSTALRQGLFHKLSECLAVVLSVFLEYACDYIELGIELPILNIVSVYICVMELVSIIENLCGINPRLEKLFKPYLEKLKDVEE